MTNQLKMMVGVAVFAALALAGTLGAFVFGAAQPVEAQTNLATRSFNPTPVAPGAEVVVEIDVPGSGVLPVVSEMWPSGFTYKAGSASGGTNDPVVDENARTVRFGSLAAPITFTYTLTAPAATPSDNFQGTIDVGEVEGQTVGGPDMVTVSASGGTGGTMPMYGSVRAQPTDPGAVAQITVRFDNPTALEPENSITISVDDNTGVPSAISADEVSISGMDDGVSVAAAPRSVIVEEDTRAEVFKITLYLADMDTSDSAPGPNGLDDGDVTVTFRQTAGITNRTEGGSDDWSVYTSESMDAMDLDGYTVPFMIELSSYGDARGEDITAIGKGFKNGTTVRFWRDEDMSGSINGGEVTLCSATATGDDIAECSFTLSNPPFDPGEDGNYINAVDGRNNKANDGGEKDTNSDLPVIELEPSMSVNPTQGSPGDNVNIQLYDFNEGDMVTKIDFGRSFIVCDDDSGTRAGACPGSWGTVGEDGGLSFSFEIPNGITPGIQQMRVYAGDADVDDNFAVGLGSLQVSSSEVLPNQRISLTGSGFTTSRGQASAYIGYMGDIPSDSACGSTQISAVLLGGTQISWDRINDGDAIEVTSGGTWAAAIDLPINSLTTVASTRELKIIDCMAGVATVDLTFPEREVTMSPERGRVGSEVIISGKNFPAANDDGSDNEITVMYDADGEIDDDDVEPDGLGNWTVILEVPEDASIPSNNTVTVQFLDDTGATVTETRTHRVPQGTVSFGAASGAEGSLLTITAEGFARYTSVDEVMFGDRDITPSPKPSTDTTGDVEFQVRIPGSDPGIYIIKVEVSDVSATQTFTVVSGSGVVDGSVDSILANVISEDALDRVFKFDNMTKEWQWYINDPAFSSTNNLAGLSSGDLVWIKVSKSVTADILGTSTTLTCINEGMENEDCWNQISIP